MNMLAFDLLEELSSIVTSVMGKLGDWFLKIFFSIFVVPLFKLMDTFIDIMLMLAGVNPLDSATSDSNLITTFLQSKSISNLYMYIAVFSAVLLMILAIVQVIKTDFFSEDEKKSHAKIFRKVILGMLYIIAIPPVFLFAVSLVSQVFELLWNLDGVNQLSSLSQTVFELALSKPEWMVRAELLGENTQVLAPIPHWSIITTEQLTTLTNIYDFNFVIFVGVLGVAFYSMFMIAFAFAKRIFRLVLLYAIGPIAVAQSVTDDTKFKEWQKDVIKEMVSIFGTLIALVIFVIFCSEVNNITFLKDQVSTTNTSTIALFNMVIKALFMLVGFSVIRSGDQLLTKVVGGQMSIGDGENTYKNVQNAVKAATSPYTGAAKLGTKAFGAVKGIAKGAENLAYGAIKTGRAAAKAHEEGRSFLGVLGENMFENQRKKSFDKTRLAGEDDYDTTMKKQKESKDAIKARGIQDPGGQIERGIKSSNPNDFSAATTEAGRQIVNNATTKNIGTAGVGANPSMHATMNTIAGTTFAAGDTGAAVETAITGRINGTTTLAGVEAIQHDIDDALSDLTARETVVTKQIEVEAKAGNDVAVRTLQGELSQISKTREVVTEVNQSLKLKEASIKLNTAVTGRDREGIKDAQKTVETIIKKESN